MSAGGDRFRFSRGAPGWIGARGLFAIVYTTSVASVYFALGVVAGRALGLTPVVFLVGGLFFGLAAMTYAEGAARHPEAGGSTVFARYAFNELVSFVTGWAVILDYVIVLAATALAATGYVGALWHPARAGIVEFLLAAGIVAFVVWANIRGISPFRLSRRVVIAFGDIAVQVLIIVLGLALLFHPGATLDSVDLGSTPTWSDLIFALTVVTVAFTGLEAAAGLSAEVRIGRRRDLHRLMGGGVAVIVLVYVGIALVAISALPVHDGTTALGGRWEKAPLVGVVEQFDPHWLAMAMKWIVAISGTVALVAAANSAMLGVSRLAYALATNRQIPSALGRLQPRYGTPWVLIALSGVFAVALLAPTDLELLVGIYAFGAMLAFTIAHASVIRLRFREGEIGAFHVPLGVRFRGTRVPVPAVLGALLSAAAWVSVLVLHGPARYVGLAWMAFGLVLYVAYRRGGGKPLLRRVTIPEQALRFEAADREFGSILVPILGTPLDDDIVQTAGRLAGRSSEDPDEAVATIEAIWVFEVPLSLPLDARLPEAQVNRARRALARAKEVGEEYEGVEVATAMTRARRAGQGIVNEARRRGVEAIVLAAEEPSRIRGGAGLGGASGPLDNSVGEVTKYVVRKAECRVILTAAPVEDAPAEGPGDAPGQSGGAPEAAGSPR
ncbi:MAG: amino acid permease [Solirubrobacteraceae bacterium]